MAEPSEPPAPLTVADAYNLAVTLFNGGRRDEAGQTARAILASVPDHPDALMLLGLVHQGRGETDTALACFAQALKQRRSPAILGACAGALMAYGHTDQALALYLEAGERDPGDINAHFNAGVLLRGRDNGQAAAAFARAGRASPGHAGAHHMRALTLFDMDRVDEAAAAFRATLIADPAHSDAWTGLGVALTRLHRHADALPAQRRALAIDPARLDSAIHALDIARYCLLFDRMDETRDALATTLTHALAPGREPPGWRLLSSVLYRDLYRPLPGGVRMATQAAFDAGLAAEAGPPLSHAVPAGRPERLRIGYLSAHLKNHPIGQVTLSLFAAHDRRRVVVHGFLPAAPASDPYATRHRQGFDHVHDISGLNGPQIAERIRAAGIDVLVYLDGHMDKTGLVAMACRPAPVRVFWLGHVGGLGTVATDYVLADRVVVPPGEERFYGEAVVRVPVCYHSADRHPIAPVQPRAAYGLPDDGVVFCAFNNTEKVDAAAYAHWMEILRRVDGSVLWLSRSGRLDQQRRSLEHHAAAHGVAPSRIVLAERMPDKEQHLARHLAADLFLDTWTMNASTTALDALWAGLPLITLAGDRFSNRIASSMLTALGLPDLICPTRRAYVAMAESLALNPQLLAGIRGRLWAARADAPLFAMPAFAAKLEAAYGRMWEHWSQGKAPAGFDLDA